MPDEQKPEDEVVVVAAEDDAQPAAEVVAKPAITADEGIDALKTKLAAEQVAREAAERRANEAATREAEARGETQDSQLAQITTALDVVTRNAEALESNYATLAAAGEWVEAAKVQTAMARNESHRVQLEQGKASLEAAPKPRAAVTEVRPADPVEALAKQLSPRSAAWVRAHPEFASGAKYQGMLGAHNAARSKGIKGDSDEYFAEVERILDIGQRPAAKAPVGDDDALPGEKPLTAAA